jgi:hypothetical protein
MATVKQNFVDQEIRPLSEDVRWVLSRLESMKTSWFAGLDVAFANDATPYDDGRPGDGLTAMVESDIHSFMTIAIAMEAAGNDEIIEKPTVRVLGS